MWRQLYHGLRSWERRKALTLFLPCPVRSSCSLLIARELARHLLKVIQAGGAGCRPQERDADSECWVCSCAVTAVNRAASQDRTRGGFPSSRQKAFSCKTMYCQEEKLT